MRELELATLELTATPPMGPPSMSSKFVYSTPTDDILGLHHINYSEQGEGVDTEDVPLSYKLALDLDLTQSTEREHHFGSNPHGHTLNVDDIEYDHTWNTTQSPTQNERDREEEEEHPFLLGLAIDIPENDDDIFPEIESCDDEDEDYSDCDPVSPDIDAELDLDRKFTMKKYQYIENIGIGAYGIVDKVLHCRRQQYVAIKQSRCVGEKVQRQFRSELSILQEFAECEYIIDLVDYGRNVDANQICLGLEWMDIGSLCNLSTYSMDQIKFISKCVLTALDALHRRLYVHNDVKPDNILISTAGDVKLIDFGCAMKMEDASKPLTKPVGSIRYHSFEKRFCSPVQYTTKSDIYSFGLTLAELFNGDHTKCQNAGTPYDRYFVTTSPTLRANQDPLFDDFMAKCLEQDANTRWSAAALLEHPFLETAPSHVRFGGHGDRDRVEVVQWPNVENDMLFEFRSSITDHEGWSIPRFYTLYLSLYTFRCLFF